jgi:predicted methyltransferase
MRHPVFDVVSFAQHMVKFAARPGDVVVDATVGNGGDTMFLARLVGREGHVFGFDSQLRAIISTTGRLREAGLESRVVLFHSGHEEMARHVPGEWHGHVAAVMFNLGYLPRGAKDVVTRPETTIAGLEASLTILRPGGILSIAVYTGHPGGADEGADVESWLRSLPGDLFGASVCRSARARHNAPWVGLVSRRENAKRKVHDR